MRTWQFTFHDNSTAQVSAHSYDVACALLGDRLAYVRRVRIVK